MSYWRDKAALVTGGSAGLGKHVAAALVRRGARVAILARGADALAAAARSLGEHGEVLPIAGDVTRDEDVAQAVATTIERLGRLDVVVNNVGRSTRGAALETSPAEFQALWELNFLGAVRVTQAATPHLLAARGHLVQIGSLAAKIAARHLGAYPASKFALAAYSQQLRLELEPRGLHVLLVCPGPIAGDESEFRYASEAEGLPEAARQPGAGARIKALDPRRVAEQILQACERRQAELIVPAKARVLLAAYAVSPRLGDWLLRRFTGGS